MRKVTFFSFCALTLKEGIAELSLIKIGLVSELVHVMSEWAVISLFADVEVKQTTGLSLEEIVIDLIVTLLVLGSQKSHIIIWFDAVKAGRIRLVAFGKIAVTVARRSFH